MSNSRKIKIFADAANLGSAKNPETNDLINFRRGDSLEIGVAFLQDAKAFDISSAVSATLEILDIGGFNAVNPREVSLLMRKECAEFTQIESGLSLGEIAENGFFHAVFSFGQSETSVPAGEKWMRIFVDFADGSRVTFSSGWICVLENYSAEPNLLPLNNPRYYTKAEADEVFLSAQKNLSDLSDSKIARDNLGVFSKSETQGIVNQAVAGSHSHAQYLEKSLNLSDLPDANTALNNLGGVNQGDFFELQSAVNENKKGLQTLAFAKENFAVARFCGGYLKTKPINWKPMAYSFCFNLKLDKIPSSCVPILSVSDVLKIAAGESGINVSVKAEESEFTSIFSYEASEFEIGKSNALVFIVDFKIRFIKLFANGKPVVAASSGAWGEIKNFSAQCLIGSDGNIAAEGVEVSRVKIFNADMSAENPVYSVDDFSGGMGESRFLLLGLNQNSDENLGASSNGGWANASAKRGDWSASIGVYNSRYIANADLSDDAEAAALGIDYAVDYSSQPGSINPAGYPATSYLYNNAINLKEFAGRTIQAHISFYAKKLNANGGIFVRLSKSAGNSAKLETFSPSLFSSDSWTFIDKIVEFSVPDVSIPIRISICAPESDSSCLGAYRLAKFNFEVLGALASFDMQADSNQIKDSSLNQNNAESFGLVDFSLKKNPAHCFERLAWAGTQASQESSVAIPKNSIVEIFAKSASEVSISACVNSKTLSADLEANVLARVGEWISGEDCAATVSPSGIFTGEIEFFYKIERL